MQTYSHFLLTAVANRGLAAKQIPVHHAAMLVGAVMPDVPLFILSLGYMANRYRCGLSAAEDPLCGPRFNDLYFHNPWWMAAHNLWHAPIHIALMLAVGYWFGLRQQKVWGIALFWFAVACGGHTLIDIFTHHDDGPLIFFPVNWHYRFPSPVSYWDADYGGRIFAPLEHLLDAAMAGYFLIDWLKSRRKAGAA
jgi:hypothetical protein